jgi:hypothetical protein
MAEARQPRLQRAELHTLMLGAGRSILLDRGLRTQATSLTFKDALERVSADTGYRFTNASIIGRIWKDQSDYQLEVLTSIASEDFRSEVDVVIDAVSAVLAGVDLSSRSSRAVALREVCRVGGAANVEALRRSAAWSLWIGIWSIAASSGSSTERRQLQSALTRGYEAVNRQSEAAFGDLMGLLAIRARAPLTVRQFSDAVGALAEGCSLRDRVNEDMAGIMRPTGPDGQEQEWTVFAIGLAALADEFFEPVEDSRT